MACSTPCKVAFPAEGAVAGASFDLASTDTSACTPGCNMVVHVAVYTGGGGDCVDVVDNKSNTYVALAEANNANGHASQFWYVLNANVGSGHVISLNTNGNCGSVHYVGAVAAGFAGVDTSSAVDQEAGNSANGVTTLEQGAAQTPSESGTLILSGIAVDGALSDLAIDESMTIVDSVAFDSGDHFGGGFAYKYYPSTVALNPTWTWTSSVNAASKFVNFTCTDCSEGAGGLGRLILTRPA